MGREVRRVPADWQHPEGTDGRYKPMHDRDFETEAQEWLSECIAWSKGEHPDQNSERLADMVKEYPYFWQWHGDPPDAEYYRPAWPEESRTHLQMYETTSEGTPISPVMATPEELARWLADNKAGAFADMTATYEQWLDTISRGFAPSMVMTVQPDGRRSMESGVAAMKSESKNHDRR